MNELESRFEDLATLSSGGQIQEVLSSTARFLHTHGRFDEAFEVNKCLIRHQIGLPIHFNSSTDSLNSQQQQLLEDQLLELCRTIGSAHVTDGQLERGWMYLQPLMDRPFVESLFAKIEVDENNLEDLIEIGLGQWAAPRTGYQLLIDTRGTCNAITFFETQISFQDEQLRSELAELLVQHIHGELLGNVVTCIVDERKGLSREELAAATLEAVIADHTWIFDSCGHHLDVSHLASAVRIARFCRQPEKLDLARQIAIYGRQLDDQLQLHGEVPFEAIFESHIHYFNAMLQLESQCCVEYFELAVQRSRDVRAIEILVKIYSVLGHSELAISTAIKHCDALDMGLKMLELAESAADFDALKKHYRDQADLASYSIASAASVANKKKPSH